MRAIFIHQGKYLGINRMKFVFDKQAKLPSLLPEQYMLKNIALQIFFTLEHQQTSKCENFMLFKIKFTQQLSKTRFDIAWLKAKNIVQHLEIPIKRPAHIFIPKRFLGSLFLDGFYFGRVYYCKNRVSKMVGAIFGLYLEKNWRPKKTKVHSRIAGFHMKSLKFKLQNY